MSTNLDHAVDTTPEWTPDSRDLSGQPYPYRRVELVEPDWTRLPGWADVSSNASSFFRKSGKSRSISINPLKQAYKNGARKSKAASPC